VQSTRLLANHKTAGPITLQASPQAGKIARIYAFGYIATAGVVILPLIPIIMAVGAVESQRWRAVYDPSIQEGLIFGLPFWVWTVLGLIAYFGVFLLWSVLRHCFVTMPLWRHYAETLSIQNPDALAAISQKDRDEFREAEGFAEALDLGAAI
jgi:hypothetical protein